MAAVTPVGAGAMAVEMAVGGRATEEKVVVVMDRAEAAAVAAVAVAAAAEAAVAAAVAAAARAVAAAAALAAVAALAAATATVEAVAMAAAVAAAAAAAAAAVMAAAMATAVAGGVGHLRAGVAKLSEASILKSLEIWGRCAFGPRLPNRYSALARNCIQRSP